MLQIHLHWKSMSDRFLCLQVHWTTPEGGRYNMQRFSTNTEHILTRTTIMVIILLYPGMSCWKGSWSLDLGVKGMSMNTLDTMILSSHHHPGALKQLHWPLSIGKYTWEVGEMNRSRLKACQLSRTNVVSVKSQYTARLISSPGQNVGLVKTQFIPKVSLCAGAATSIVRLLI